MKIQLLVSCSASKRGTDGPVPQIRDLRRKRFDSRVREWIKAVSSVNQFFEGNKLYKGQYWSVIRSIQHDLNRRGIPNKTTIISAGLGILKESDKVPVYSSTFSKDSPDYVFATKEARRGSDKTTADWIKATTISISGPKRLELIKRRSQGGKTIVLLPPQYLESVIPFLVTIAKNDLIIFSSRPNLFPGFEESIVPINSDLQPYLGGAQISLSGRMAKHVLESANSLEDLNPRKVKCTLKSLSKVHGKRRTYDRFSVTDEKIRKLIREYSKMGIQNYTPMLRILRDSGFACEMKRFRSIFKEVKSNEKGA